jgi:predicted SAM-dependent methyltransferase
VGCGRYYNPDWVNLDRAPTSPDVVYHDIPEPLPFPNDFFDAVYHSHLIEHLAPAVVHPFLTDMHRVLKPNGIMRVVTPDLETIAQLYLNKLHAALEEKAGAKAEYEWIVLELFDQIARCYPGGEMLSHLHDLNLKNNDFIASRIGPEFENFQKCSKQSIKNSHNILANIRFRSFARLSREKLAYYCTRIIAGKEAGDALKTGLFRHSGEIHYKLYDRYSLSKLLESHGFKNIHICRPDESAIPDFINYSLDVINGVVRKPDSIFIEGVKP